VEGGQVTLNGGAALMPAPISGSAPVTLGVRPEDVALTEDGPTPFRVDIVEELGAHRLLHGALYDQPFTIQVGKNTAAATGETRITLNPEALRLFDKDTGVAL
jgi:sn-glycerol 3-phosphate transport system ATP-binding protein